MKKLTKRQFRLLLTAAANYKRHNRTEPLTQALTLLGTRRQLEPLTRAGLATPDLYFSPDFKRLNLWHRLTGKGALIAAPIAAMYTAQEIEAMIETI